MRDEVVDFVRYWSACTQLPQKQLLHWLSMSTSTFYSWKERYNEPNRHGGGVPKCHWITASEREAITAYYLDHPEEGYRRLTYIMLDENVAAVSPSTTYRVLKKAGYLDKWAHSPSRKGTGFNQPQKPHAHWRIRR